MDIVNATTQDAAEILALQRLAYQSEAAIYDDYAIPPLAETLAEFELEFGLQTILKAVVDGRIVGSVRGRERPGTCCVGRLIVHPDRQRKGIATALMQHLERMFPSVRRFELFTGHKSAGNIRLYERLGYRAFKRQIVSDRLTLVFMVKSALREP